MPSYKIDTRASKLVVTARSKVHDTDTSWHGIAGTIEADLDNMAATQANISVDMTTADAGDWLKNRKLRKDMDFDQHPEARFTLSALKDVAQDGAKVNATVVGSLNWRNKSVEIEAKGSGTITESKLVASGHFELDVTKLGVKPPKVLMIKIDDIVGCKIEIVASV